MANAPFRGQADQAVAPPAWFRDEDGIEWAGPHGVDAECPWGFCSEMDFREYELVTGGEALEQHLRLKAPVVGFGPGEGRPFCHTVDGDYVDWAFFVNGRTFIKEIV